MQYRVTDNTQKNRNSSTIFLRPILEKIALFMSNCVIHVKNSQFHSSEYLKYFQVRDHNLDRKEGFIRLNKEFIAARLLKTCFIEPRLIITLQVGEHALNANALKQGACQSKQRKIGMLTRLCFNGLDIAMLR